MAFPPADGTDRVLTPAAVAFIEDLTRRFRPRVDDLATMVAEILGCDTDDARVSQCVASIHAQWMLFVPNPVASRFRAKLQLRSDDAAKLADHITRFSLAGIQAFADSAAH